MRASQFWSVMDEVFGPVYSRSLAGDLVISALGGLTPQQALDAGVPPREVWEAVCEATDQPENVRWLHRAANRPHRGRD